jgi:hypothetical protein
MGVNEPLQISPFDPFKRAVCPNMSNRTNAMHHIQRTTFETQNITLIGARVIDARTAIETERAELFITTIKRKPVLG